jgi:Zn-dependent protease
MGFQDRRYDERRAPDEGFWRRVLGHGDNFFSWAFRLFEVAGITVRLHITFIIYVVATLLGTMRGDSASFSQAAVGLICLFGLVLLHEFGHCIACRWVQGEADEIVLWPLGGLAMCRPPNTWKASLVTTLGGPGVNLLLLPVLGGALYAATGTWDTVLFYPAQPGKGAFLSANIAGVGGKWLFWLHATNFYLLAFNMLLPMYPMDAGRVMQELLWWRVGRDRSIHIAASLGLLFAVVVGTVSLVRNETQLFCICLFAGFSCWQAKQSLRFMAETGGVGLGGGGGGGGPEFPTAYAPVGAARDEAKYKAAVKEQQRQQSEEVEVDRILAKISAQGMDSLSRSERKILERQTQRRRSGRG